MTATIDGLETDHLLVQGDTAHYSNTTNHPYIELVGSREKECLQLESAYSKRLASASVWNPLTRSFPILITTLLGAGFFAEGKYKTLVDGIALYAAFNAAVHKALQCDEFQDECVTMIQKYKALAVKYRTLREVKMDEQKLDAYEDELAGIAAATKLTTSIMTNAATRSKQSP
jgi:hypothetical protein